MSNARSQTRSRETVYIYDLVHDGQNDILEDISFEDCTIIGPAVLIVLDDVRLVGCRFPNADVLWPPLEIDRLYFGAIGIQKCDFRDCRFERVGLAGNQQFIDRFRSEIGSNPGGKRPAERKRASKQN